MLRDVVLSIRMFFSTALAAEMRSAAALHKLRDEIEWCNQHVMNVTVVVRLLKDITVEAHKAEARALIASYGSLTCKQFAINFDPSYAKVCADELLATAQERIEKHVLEREHADFVHQLLVNAAEWYARVGALTPALAAKIETDLRKTEWVLRS